MEQAIKIAIENGYNGYVLPFCSECGGYEAREATKYTSMFLEPSFWQALGKGLGWKHPLRVCRWCNEAAIDDYCLKAPTSTARGSSPHNFKETEIIYRPQWHRFIDHLVEGKDIDSFFEELLK